MGDSWFVIAARCCLCGFQVVVGGLVVWTVARLATGRPPCASAGRWGRFCFEYLGNVDPVGSADRRRNLHGRELMDWVKRQIEKRGLPAGQQEEQFLSTVRRTLGDD